MEAVAVGCKQQAPLDCSVIQASNDANDHMQNPPDAEAHPFEFKLSAIQFC